MFVADKVLSPRQIKRAHTQSMYFHIIMLMSSNAAHLSLQCVPLSSHYTVDLLLIPLEINCCLCK